MRPAKKYSVIVMKTKRAKSKMRRHRTQKRNPRKTQKTRYARGPPELYTDLPMREQIEKVLELVVADKMYLNKELLDPRTGKPILTNANHWNKLTAWNADQVLRGGNRSDMTNIIFMLTHPDLSVRAKNKKIWLDHILQHMFSNLLVTNIVERGNYPMIKHRGGKITLRNATIVLLEHRLVLDQWNTRRLEKKEKRPPTPYPVEPVPEPPIQSLFNQRAEDVPDDWNAENVTNIEPVSDLKPAPEPKEYKALD